MVNASVNNAILYIAKNFYFLNQLWLSEVCAFDPCHWIDFKNAMIYKSDNDDIDFLARFFHQHSRLSIWEKFDV